MWDTKVTKTHGRVFIWTPGRPGEEPPDVEPIFKTAGQSRAYDLEKALEAGMLQELIQHRGDTQQTVAMEIGVSVRTIRRWASGATAPYGLYRQALLKYITEG